MPAISLGVGTIFKDTDTGEVFVDSASMNTDRASFVAGDFDDNDLGRLTRRERQQIAALRARLRADDGNLSPDDRAQIRALRRELQHNDDGAGRGGRGGRQPVQAPPSTTQAATTTGAPDMGQYTNVEVLSEQDASIAASSQATMTIRPQADFKADKISFDGSAPEVRVNQIWFAKKLVFNSTGGVPVSSFAPDSNLLAIVAGETIKGGLDIRVIVSNTDGAAAKQADVQIYGHSAQGNC